MNSEKRSPSQSREDSTTVLSQERDRVSFFGGLTRHYLEANCLHYRSGAVPLREERQKNPTP